MVTISRNGKTYRCVDITSEIVNAATPVYPLHQTVIGVRVLDHQHEEWCCRRCSFLCLAHQNLTSEETSPITLKEALEEAAFCQHCKSVLYIPDGYREWDILSDRLCSGDYSNVEIFTNTTHKTPFHYLFNAVRLVPGSKTPEKLLPENGGFDAKDTQTERRDRWPNAIWVEPELFEQEVQRRQA